MSIRLWARSQGLTLLEEHRFHPVRRWRFDYALPELMLALEVEGVVWYGNRRSRHQTAKGYAADCEKYNAAQLLGWTVLRYTQEQWRAHVWYEDVTTVAKQQLAGQKHAG